MKRRNNLFLTELVLCLFLFAAGAAVCVGLLLRAENLSRESGELTEAVYLAQSAAEVWKGGGAPEAQELPAGYELSCTLRGGALDISVLKDGRLIYTIEGVSRLDEP